MAVERGVDGRLIRLLDALTIRKQFSPDAGLKVPEARQPTIFADPREGPDYFDKFLDARVTCS